MQLRSGKTYTYEAPMNQPFRMIVLRDKIPKKEINKIPEGIPPSKCMDFEHASREWRKNKINIGGGMFIYKSPGRNS